MRRVRAKFQHVDWLLSLQQYHPRSLVKYTRYTIRTAVQCSDIGLRNYKVHPYGEPFWR